MSTKIELPKWIEEISPCQIASVNRSGCAGGGYMPAVTYASARATMSEHGDDVLDYLDDHDSMPTVPDGTSWSGMACLYLAKAVELFCSLHAEHADWDHEDWS